jgi:TorA maturation chaperone TorD
MPRIPVRAATSTRSMPRAQEYALLSVLLARAPMPRCWSVSPIYAATRARSGSLMPRRGGGGAHQCERVEREYFDLFIGLGRGELALRIVLSHRLPARAAASHACARISDKLGIERSPGQAEPEDHAAILCEIMAGLVSRRFPLPGADRALFEEHLAPWIGRFFADLERAEAADFYRRLGTLGRMFMEIETEAFALPA